MSPPLYLVFAVLAVSLFLIAVHGDEDTSVRIQSGLINGSVREFEGTKVRQYLSIPFAEPPIGELRFKKPRPIAQHADVEGTNWPPKCVQPPFPLPLNYHTDAQSEDCLFLNVWSPVAKIGALKPVMVWIHGGGYEVGGASFDLTDGLALCGAR